MNGDAKLPRPRYGHTVLWGCWRWSGISVVAYRTKPLRGLAGGAQRHCTKQLSSPYQVAVQ